MTIYDTIAQVFRSDLVPEWVVRVDQPMIWLYQMARSGGTMALRLFDGHPEVHVHPAPIDAVWPLHVTRTMSARVRDRFGLARFNRVGWRKRASNLAQQAIPIYFDERWYRRILRTGRPSTPRELLDAACTARFNAWRNYQSLYGAKRFQLLHSAIWHHRPAGKMVERFFRIYPDGYVLFIARSPEDWLASLVKIDDRSRPRWLHTPEDYLAEYAAGYERFLGARRDTVAERVLILDFDRLVLQPRAVLTALCARLGIGYHPALETTTVNKIPVSANSSHADSPGFAPDPSRIGRGADVRAAIEGCPSFPRARRLFEEARAAALGAPPALAPAASRLATLP